MRTTLRSSVCLLFLFVGLFSSSIFAGAVGQEVGQEVDSKVDSVVLYGLGADVRRTATVDLPAGVHELLFASIPRADDEPLDGLRASASDPWKILGVDVRWRSEMEIEDESNVVIQQAVIRRLRSQKDLLEMRCEGIRSDLGFVDAIGVRTAADATAASGTDQLDLEAVREQLEFVRQERSRLQDRLIEEEQLLATAQANLEQAELEAERAGPGRRQQVVRVRVAVPEAGEGQVSIRYLSGLAGWEPGYSIYSTKDSVSMPINYEAIVTQATGEDWEGVQMTLSTATPSMPSGPPDIRPVYVDRQREISVNAAMPEMALEKREVFGSSDSSTLEMIRNAAVNFGGSAVTYKLPGRVSVATDKQGSSRLRIAEFVAPASRVLVARPVVNQKVYLRADLVNESDYVLLSGEASLFMEGEFVGPTRLDAVPAGGDFKVWFGPDPSVTAKRTVVSRKTDRTGLLGGGRQTSIEYRIDVVNTGDEEVTVEVWDRRPVSLDGDIEIRVVDVEPPLSDADAYRQLAEKQGLLKWVLKMKPRGTTGADQTISWTVRVNRSSDLDITPIPE